ncbi:unnamed protein product, partial [Ectocarpus sp. 8 AP-2014]
QSLQVFKNLSSSSGAPTYLPHTIIGRSIKMRVLSTATAVLAFERGTVTTSSAFQVLVPSSGSGRSTAAARRSSSNKAFPWAASSFRRRAGAVPLWCTSQTTDVAATAEGKGAKKEEGRGHGHGGGVKPKT